MSIEPPLPHEIVAFWRDAGHERWFGKSDAFDEELREQFEGLHFAAARGELADWAETADGSLALLILLDQVPRNIFRGSAHAYATDPLAKSIAEAAIAAGHDQAFDLALRCFFYLPFEHSESLQDQDRCVELSKALDADTLQWAEMHRDIICRFGRFPHRNAALGRETTAAEAAFLAEGGFAG